jgi:hypothetical protein
MNKILTVFLITLFCFNLSAVEIKGTVFDETGKGIANAPVRFVMKKTKFDIKTFENKVIDTKIKVFKTDKKGFFKFEPEVDSYFNVFVLEFNGENFDYAKYIVPSPEDITSKIKNKEAIVVNRTYKTHPDWLKLQIAIEGYAKTSPKYKILRKYGFPDKRDLFDNGEKWYYFNLGREFLIKK